MSQCVPSWDVEDNPATATGTLRLCSNSSGRTEPNSTINNILDDVPMSDYEVAELTWENGQLVMHALGPPWLPLKSSSTWDKLRATGTLESLVDQATNNCQLPFPLPSSYHRGKQQPPKFEGEGGLVPWINLQRPSSASATVTMDALVPCSINTRKHNKATPTSTNTNNMNMMMVGCSSTRVGSCSANAGQLDQRLARVPVAPHGQELSCSHDQSFSGCSANNNNNRLIRNQQQHHKADLAVGFTRSATTLDNTSSDMPSPDDHDSLCHSSRPPRHQREIDDDEDDEEEGHNKKKKSGGHESKSSGSTKRTRAAAIHNQSERKRRDKINQRMKTLQKLVPNSSKADKASMLDEVIEYLKQLQAQVHVMSRMNMPAAAPMMLPLAMQQQLQMSMMGPMGMGLGMGMGMGMGMDMNPMGRPNIPAAMAPSVLHPSAFMPMNPASWGDHASTDQRLQAAAAAAPTTLPDPLSAFLACQSQPLSMEAYSRMAAMYQQLQQNPAPNSKS